MSERVARDTGLQVSEYLDKTARSGTRRAYGADYARTNPVPNYLKPVVLIELTRMGSPHPNAYQEIESLLATFVHQTGLTTAVFDEFQGFMVVVLEPRRTLVEKLCALEYQSLRVATGQAEFTRMARHFYDVGSLLTSNTVVATLNQDEVIAMASEHFALSKDVRRETGARPEGGFANSAWLTNLTAMEKAKEAYDVEVPELAYVVVPTFAAIQDQVRSQASLL